MADSDGDSPHFTPVGFGNAHKPVRDAYDGGACINGRCQASYDTVTCSYRYQGIEAAKKYKNIYNNKNIAAHCHIDGRRGAPRTRIYEVLSTSGKRRKVAINGKYRVLKAGRVFDGEPPPVAASTDKVYECYKDDALVFKKDFWFVNFTVSSVPWKNQVHHVLNHSSLVKVIGSFENITDVISLGLLEELYNINHKDNMVILPTEDKWTRKTGLPTHGSHPAYSKPVKAEVSSALSGYESINEQAADPGHPKPDPIALKERLLKISKKWYKKIIDVVPKNKQKKESDEVIKINDIK